MRKDNNIGVTLTLEKKDYDLFKFFAQRVNMTPTRFIRKLLENINKNRKTTYLKMVENNDPIPSDIDDAMKKYLKQ